MSRRSFRFALATVVGVIVTIAVVGVVLVRAATRYPDQPHGGKGRDIQLEIPKGAKLPEIADQLGKAGVIDRPTWFRLYAMNRGLGNRVRAGKYVLKDNMTPKAVLDTLVEGGLKEPDLMVTVPEGKNLKEVCAILADAGLGSAAELERTARDATWLKAHGIDAPTADGYLFPDTYRFRPGTPPAKVLEAMVARHRVVYAEEAKQHAKALARLKKELSWSDRDIVTLASIVEKETASPDERPRVASVFFNRLTLPGFPSRRLETDPTIRYGCTIPLEKSEACKAWDPAGRLFEKQLDDSQNPYNTYRHAGLPPGPISNPGRASIAAAMEPEKTEFLYFVAQDERSHHFSKTVAEHNEWVKKYVNRQK